MKNKIITQYYILSFMYSAMGLAIISAIYATYMIKHGLNLFEINVVNVTYFATLFLCEIPTGVFADVFGRKKSFVIACALMSIGMFVYGSSDSMFGFIAAEVVSAIGATFHTGAFQSWLVDSLKHHGYTGTCTKIFARENIINQIGAGFGAIVGSYLSIVHPSLPWYIGGIGLGFATVLAFIFMKEDYFVRKIISWKMWLSAMIETTKKSFSYARNDKAVRFVLLITSVQTFAVTSYNMYWQPFFGERGVAEYNYGYLFAGLYGAIALGSYISTHIKTDGKERSIIIWSQIFSAVCVVIAVCFSNLPIVIIFFISHEIGRGFWKPMKNGYLHSRITSSEERATIVSFTEILPHISGALGLLVSGIVAEIFGITVSWTMSSLILIISAIIYIKNGKR